MPLDPNEIIAPPWTGGTPRTRPPTFSVLIPVHQGSATIGAAIDSVLDQTHPAHETIVCNDGSTDDLEGAIAPYRDGIVYVEQPNRGPAAARNLAARQATGEFLALLDADDALLPERLEKLGELGGLRPDLDLLSSDGYFERGGVRVGTFNTAENPFPALDQRQAILQRNFFFPNPAVRRERFLAIGGFDETLRRAEDWDCWIRLILSGSKAGSVREPLGCYRLNESSLASDRPRALRSRVVVLEKTAGRTDLYPADLDTLRLELAAQHKRALLVEAEAALLSGQKDARRICWMIASDPTFAARTRVKVALSAVAPGLSARVLARADRDRMRRPLEGDS